MDLLAGCRTKRTKSNQVQKGSAYSNKGAKTVVEGYIEHLSRPDIDTASTESSASHSDANTNAGELFMGLYLSSIMRPPWRRQLPLQAFAHHKRQIQEDVFTSYISTFLEVLLFVQRYIFG